MIAPLHLGELAAVGDRMTAERAEQMYFWFSVPPRHHKTWTLLAFIVKFLARWPTKRVLYVTYNDQRAADISMQVRDACEKLGWKFKHGFQRQKEWLLESGGGFFARGIGSAGVGYGFDLIIVDDPYKDRPTAHSPTEREKIYNAINGDIIERLSPSGALLLVHTRWVVDDAIARFKKQGWKGQNIPALTGDDGHEVALFPEKWSVKHLLGRRKANPSDFAAKYQGEPIPIGSTMFSSPASFEWGYEPREGKIAYGVDLAYSEEAQKRADFSVCVRMLMKPGDDGRPRYYVLDVLRRQVQAPEFTLALKAVHAQRPGPMLWEIGGTEKGVHQFMVERLPMLRTKPAVGKVYQRAQAVSEAWNEGRVFVPTGEARPDWVDDFVAEVTSFTGLGSGHDDQVAALASAFSLFEEKSPDWDFLDAMNKSLPKSWIDGGDGGGVGW